MIAPPLTPTCGSFHVRAAAPSPRRIWAAGAEATNMAGVDEGEIGEKERSCSCDRAGALFLCMPVTIGQSLDVSQISIDIAIVLADLSHTFLSDSCTPQTETPLWLEILSHISLVITITFLVELIVSVWAFGPRYYSPFRSVLHFCDGSVIIMTFVVEVGLRGRERELAALLIFFRLLRFAGEGGRFPV